MFDEQKYADIKLSSAGLVYRHFGVDILKTIAQEKLAFDVSSVPVDEWDGIHKNIYRNFVVEIDAIDNGVEMGEGLRYKISTGIAS